MAPASAALRAVAAPEDTQAVTPVARKPQDFENELWVGIPKDKTLGIAVEAFLKVAGLVSADKVNRIDDYTIETPQGTIRLFEMKGKAALGLMATRRMDGTIVGRDGLKPFNAAVKKQKGFVQASETIDLDMAPCMLTICLPENEQGSTPADLNGKTIAVAAKFRQPLEEWAKRNNVQFARIVDEIMPGVPIEGGVEGFRAFDKEVNAMCDVLQSAESAVQYGWKPLGVLDQDWLPIRTDVLSGVPKTERRTYSDLPKATIKDLPGTIIPSNPVFARISTRLSPQKERLMELFEDSCMAAASALGKEPVRRGKRYSEQQAAAAPAKRDAYTIEGYGVHSRFGY